MTPRTCSYCGAQIAADAPAHKIFCAKVCKEAQYRRARRDRRPDRPVKRRPPPPSGAHLDAVAARLRRRERDILDDWRNRR